MIDTLAVGFLGGLLSGVGVYLVRQKTRADRLRAAISMEVRYSTPLDSLSTAFMGEDALETPIIDSNLDKIHLLTEDEIVEVANFHRHMSQVRNHFEMESEDEEVKVHIPSKLQRDSKKYARTTVEELEGNIWNLSNLYTKVKSAVGNASSDEG